MFSMNKREIAY